LLSLENLIYRLPKNAYIFGNITENCGTADVTKYKSFVGHYTPPCQSGMRYRDEDIVPVIVAYTEKVLRDKLKSAGGKWNPSEKLWRVPFGAIRGNAELEDRILKD